MVYSYFSDFIGSRFAAFIAGYKETMTVIKIDTRPIIEIDKKFISEGILLKK